MDHQPPPQNGQTCYQNRGRSRLGPLGCGKRLRLGFIPSFRSNHASWGDALGRRRRRPSDFRKRGAARAAEQLSSGRRALGCPVRRSLFTGKDVTPDIQVAWHPTDPPLTGHDLNKKTGMQGYPFSKVTYKTTGTLGVKDCKKNGL